MFDFVLFGADVEVITREARLLATPADVDAYVIIIRALVLRETRVTIDAIRAVGRSKIGDGRIELADAIDKIFGQCLDCLLRLFVFGFMRREPFLVIVAYKVTQEGYYLFHVEFLGDCIATFMAAKIVNFSIRCILCFGFNLNFN